jgi:hypothetical protein
MREELPLGTSGGMGAQLPAGDQPALSGWHPGQDLMVLEEEMVAAAAAGNLVDRGKGPFSLAEMQTWGNERTIRAAVLRHLLTAGQWPVDTKGVRLRGVRISGHLDLEAAVLRCSLSLDCCYLDTDLPACLDQATALRVTLTRCQLAGPVGEMLTARKLDLSDSTLTGPLILPGADITGQLICRGTQLTGTDSDGNALVADAMKVGGDVFLDEGFAAAGTVSLNSAHVDASVLLAPAALGAQDEVALDAARAQISGTLRWAPAAPVSGQVDLEGATVGHLEDDWSGNRRNGYWPTGGRLRLDGFTYGRFGGARQATVEQRLAWIRSQYHPRAGDSPADFAAQPYEQLAAVYRQAGQDDQARKVAIARRADLRRYGDLNWYRWFGNWFLDRTIRYGYQTWRAAAGLAAVFVVFLALSILAQHQHVIVPVRDIEGLHSVPSAAQCTSDYPCFYPAGYAVDTVIPIINVHQADYWGPDGHAPWGWAWNAGTWIATGLGWALATLLVAGYTGLVRQE